MKTAAKSEKLLIELNLSDDAVREIRNTMTEKEIAAYILLLIHKDMDSVLLMEVT